MAAPKARGHVVLGPVGVRALIPDDYSAGAVFAQGDDVAEFRVVDRVVLGAAGHPPVLRVDQRAAGDSPCHDDTVDLQAKLVVVATRRVVLDHELRPALAPSSASWLHGAPPVAPISPIVAQTHRWRVAVGPCAGNWRLPVITAKPRRASAQCDDGRV